MSGNNIYKYLLLAVGIIFIASCKPTRWVGENEYLLKKNKVIVDNKEIDKKELSGYIRQKSNRSIFFIFKINLAAYNYSQTGKKQGKFKKWVERVIGEPPAIYDSLLVEKSADQFTQYLKNNAYYLNKVDTQVKLKRKRARVTYTVTSGPAMPIYNVHYTILDSSIAGIILSDTINSKIKPNKKFTLKSLQKERKRITEQLKDSGYFYFNTDYIRYIVDTSAYKAKIEIEVQQEFAQDSNEIYFRRNHQKYYVNKIFFYPDFNPHEAIRNRKTYFNTFDTLNYNNYYFLYPGYQNIKPKTILKAESLRPGELYSLSNVKNTTKYLNSLHLFRLNNISFVSDLKSDSLLNCHVQLTPFTYQNYSVSFETTNTRGNIGIGGSFKYGHKNLFKGAEQFQIKLSGSNQFITKTEEREAFNILELSAEATLNIPAFLIPTRTDNFYKKYNPKTSFSASTNYQLRPDFDRRIYAVSMGYNWSNGLNIKNNVNAIDLSTVKVIGTDNFYNDIKGTYLENNYKDYFIAGGRYSFVYHNSADNSFRNNIYMRWNVEIAGNTMFLFDKYIFKTDTTGVGYFNLFGLQYAQFAKSDIDFRFYQKVGQNQTIVYRTYAGIAQPYGNAKATPFIRQFSAGGADGMRAWQIKDLGPGSYNVPDSVNSYPNQTSDIKIEVNVEYRFDFTKNFKGAAFVDIGNIWSITEEDSRPGAVFRTDSFYKQLAFGTGLGLRYDIQFAVIRLDAALKMRDPSLPNEYSWILFERPLEFKHINWNFAIGYPF